MQLSLGLRRPRTVRRFLTGYQESGEDCSHTFAVEICDGDQKRVLCAKCGEWLIEFGTHRDGILSSRYPGGN